MDSKTRNNKDNLKSQEPYLAPVDEDAPDMEQPDAIWGTGVKKILWIAFFIFATISILWKFIAVGDPATMEEKIRENAAEQIKQMQSEYPNTLRR